MREPPIREPGEDRAPRAAGHDIPHAPDWLDPRDARARAPLHAWWALQRHTALHPERVREILERSSDPVAALHRIGPAAGVTPLPGAGSDAFASLCERLARLGLRALPLGAPDYPERLATLRDAPPLLWVRGDFARLESPLVAVVGARRATGYGREASRQLAAALAAAGVGVVSGLARGIDAAAHRGALEAGGSTAAVLGCGPDEIYPPEHRRLAEALLERGAVLSEFPPGTPPRAHHFPLRNRIISALAAAVVVVEARPRSGSLITARHALEQGREVLVVPGPIDAPASEGSNRLLRDGAAPVLDVSDVLRAIGCETSGAAVARAASQGGALERALQHEPGTRDELARRLGWPAAALAREVLALELERRIAEEPDGRLRLIRATPERNEP